MGYSEARPGRTFILRLKDGEIVHEAIEKSSRKSDFTLNRITRRFTFMNSCFYFDERKSAFGIDA